jgi:hypothetical protein
LKCGWIFIAHDGDERGPRSVTGLQQPLNIAPDIVLNGKQHHVAAISPAFGDRPLRLDHAANTPQMLNQPDTLAVRRMHHLNAEAAKIAKDLDRHHLLPGSEPQWLIV